MSDGQGPGSHVLYQDFVGPTTLSPAGARRGSSFSSVPRQPGRRLLRHAEPGASLDFGISGRSTSRLASTSCWGDRPTPSAWPRATCLQTIYQSVAGDPRGLRLRDHPAPACASALRGARRPDARGCGSPRRTTSAPFQMGVDNVSLSAVPEPSSLILGGTGMFVALIVRSRPVAVISAEPRNCPRTVPARDRPRGLLSSKGPPLRNALESLAASPRARHAISEVPNFPCSERRDRCTRRGDSP